MYLFTFKPLHLWRRVRSLSRKDWVYHPDCNTPVSLWYNIHSMYLIYSQRLGKVAFLFDIRK